MSEPGRGVQWTGAIAGAVAAVLIALGTISPSWWSGDKGALGMGVGLRDGLGSGSAAWPKLGAIGFPMGCVASLFLLVAAAGALVAQKSRWTARFGRAASALSLFALVVGAGFAWTYPGFDGLGAGWGLAAYLGGAAIGVGAGSLLIAGGASRPAS